MGVSMLFSVLIIIFPTFSTYDRIDPREYVSFGGEENGGVRFFLQRRFALSQSTALSTFASSFARSRLVSLSSAFRVSGLLWRSRINTIWLS